VAPHDDVVVQLRQQLGQRGAETTAANHADAHGMPRWRLRTFDLATQGGLPAGSSARGQSVVWFCFTCRAARDTIHQWSLAPSPLPAPTRAAAPASRPI